MTHEAPRHPLRVLAEQHQQRLRETRLDTHYDHMMANQLFVDLTEPDPRIVQPECWIGEPGDAELLATLADGTPVTINRGDTVSLVKRILEEDERELLRQFVGKGSKISLEPRYSRRSS